MTEKQIYRLIDEFNKREEKQARTLEKIFLALVQRKGDRHLKIGRDAWSVNVFNDYERSGRKDLKLANHVKGREIIVFSLGEDSPAKTA